MKNATIDKRIVKRACDVELAAAAAAEKRNAEIRRNNSLRLLEAEEKNNKVNFRKNFVFLTYLYFLQSVPMGLSGSMTYILGSKNVSYADKATFSFVFWPFSIKLLWAPIIDAFYFNWLGRRKSWLIPIQYLIGIYMLLIADRVREILDIEQESHEKVFILTVIFFLFTVLAATQDIVVDGWALSILPKDKASYASTSECFGGTIGWFTGNVFFLVVQSKDFSNAYVRQPFGYETQDYGLVSIDMFMKVFGVIYLVTTTLILLFKRENYDERTISNFDLSEDNDAFSLTNTYRQVCNILCLVPIRKLALALFIVRFAFSTESMGYMKLVESGVPKETLGLMAIPLTPLQLILPFVIGHNFIDAKNPFKRYRRAFIMRIVTIMIFTSLVYFVTTFRDPVTGEFSTYFYVLFFACEVLHSVAAYWCNLPFQFFYTQISDKNFGATYFTFLNTLSNLAKSWMDTSVLYLASFMTFRDCDSMAPTREPETNETDVRRHLEQNGDVTSSDECPVYFDPIYLQTFICFVFGLIIIRYVHKILVKLETLPKSEWELKLKED